MQVVNRTFTLSFVTSIFLNLLVSVGSIDAIHIEAEFDTITTYISSIFSV
jgi:hypothetical protein